MLLLPTSKSIYYCVAGIALLALFTVGYALLRATSCPVTSYEVRGTSLDESAPPGSQVSVADISCARIHRGALVVFRTPADPNTPVIKRVVGMPGDTFVTRTDGAVIINGTEATVPAGRPYRLTARGITMLTLYANDYRGGIPPESYLLLGDLPEGTLDSSRIGLVSLHDIVGVVISIQK
jgi:signal peptidase I